MRQIVIAECVIMALFCGSCFANDQLEGNALKLASALNISTNATMHVASKPLFAEKENVQAGEFQMKLKNMAEAKSGQPMRVDVVGTNKLVVASGRVFERSSFEMARLSLLESLVQNSRPIPLIARELEVKNGDVGELCVVEKTFDKAVGEYTSELQAIHFVRGSTAISLYPAKNYKDIWKTAKAIDAALLLAQ